MSVQTSIDRETLAELMHIYREANKFTRYIKDYVDWGRAREKPGPEKRLYYGASDLIEAVQKFNGGPFPLNNDFDGLEQA